MSSRFRICRIYNLTNIYYKLVCYNRCFKLLYMPFSGIKKLIIFYKSWKLGLFKIILPHRILTGFQWERQNKTNFLFFLFLRFVDFYIYSAKNLWSCHCYYFNFVFKYLFWCFTSHGKLIQRWSRTCLD